MMGLSRTIRLYRAARARQRRQGRGVRSSTVISCSRLVWQAICDPSGGEVLEFAMVAGLIIIACISIISCVGIKLTNKWSSLNKSM
jgi:Flp pilus assembly pilin Flp